MPLSATEPAPADIRLAVTAETLYLLNLLLLPGLAFVLLWWLYRRHCATAGALAANHLQQALVGSLWAGGLLLVVTLAASLLGGLHNPGTWVFLILYFTTCHASLVLLGVLGLVKAMTGQPYRYPLIGPAIVGQN